MKDFSDEKIVHQASLCRSHKLGIAEQNLKFCPRCLRTQCSDMEVKVKIAVCMKQVPAYSDGNMDQKTGLIVRSGLEAVANVYDLAALEAALQISEKTAAHIDVFTMGPEGAAQVLREAFAVGADDGYLISDRAFGGADVLATSYTLMQAIKSCGDYDLILCGKQTTDGDTAQVSGALAKWFEIPHFTGVCEVAEVDQSGLQIWQQLEEGQLAWQVSYPCLLAVERSFVPRMPSLKLRMKGMKKEIGRITLADLEDHEPERYGLKGSATKVKKIFPPPKTRKHEPVKLGETEAAAYILQTVLQIKEGGHADE